MKISSKNTALHLLDENDPLRFAIVKKVGWDQQRINRLRYQITGAIIKKRPDYRKKVQFLADPFLDAFDRARDRLTFDIKNEELIQSGTFVAKTGDSGRNTFFYNIDIHRTKEADGEEILHWKGSMMCFSSGKEVEVPMLICAYMQGFEGNAHEYVGDGIKNMDITPFEMFVELVYIILFMKYCELDTKIVCGGKKAGHAGEKYVNEVKSDVEVVDSTWFTTIIRTEGFGVQGHFRLQRCGPGMSQQKLIYIQPFEKHGYTRKAKILRDGEHEHKAAGETEGRRENS